MFLFLLFVVAGGPQREGEIVITPGGLQAEADRLSLVLAVTVERQEAGHGVLPQPPLCGHLEDPDTETTCRALTQPAARQEIFCSLSALIAFHCTDFPRPGHQQNILLPSAEWRWQVFILSTK